MADSIHLLLSSPALMNSAFPYLITVIILFISTFTRSALGFADALIAMPFLTMVLGLKTAAPLVALVATTSSFVRKRSRKSTA